jgi:signal transduction histidine kinase
MFRSLFRSFWVLTAGAAAVVLLALAVIAVASARSLDRFQAVHRHAAALARLRRIEERATRSVSSHGADRSRALEESRNDLDEVLKRHGYLATGTEPHLRSASALLVEDPLAGLSELEESLAEEMTAHEELLLRVERDSRVELMVSAALTVGMPFLGVVLLIALRKRFLLPLARLRDLMGLLARQEYRTTSTTDLDPLLQPVFDNYNHMASRLHELEEGHRVRQKTLEQAVRAATGALLKEHQELARSERLAAMGELAAGVAHELRNPLAGIQMALGAVGRETKDRDHAARLDLAVAELKRMTRMLNGLLDAARPRPEPSKRLYISTLVSDFVSLARYQIPERVSLTMSVPAELSCPLPEGGIQQALWNLVLNSVQAIGNGAGRIEIAAACGDGQLRLSVDDDGPGFPLELLEEGVRSFAPLRPGGTGLGLAMVRRFVRDLGGELHLENRRPHGASVVLSIPCLGNRA